MIADEDYKLYERAIEKWGRNEQVMMLIEEIGELLTVINKYTRQNNGCDIYQVFDEIADVEIMLDQYKVILNQIDQTTDAFIEVEEAKIEKLKRLKGRVYNNYPYGEIDEHILNSQYDGEVE